MRMVKDQDNSKSRLEAPPTPCPRCKTMMKVRKCIPLPGRKFVDVDYRCDECGAEVLRAGHAGPKLTVSGSYLPFIAISSCHHSAPLRASRAIFAVNALRSASEIIEMLT